MSEVTYNNFTVSPSSGGKLERDNYTLTVTDTAKNFGRDDRIQNRTITTYGDAERTDLKKTTNIQIKHKAATLRIFDIAISSDIPTQSNFDTLGNAKTIPSGSSTQTVQKPSSALLNNGKYYVYGITNTNSITCSNNSGSSAAIVGSSFKISESSANPGSFSAGQMNGMVLTLPSGSSSYASYGSLDIYYFYFQVNTNGNQTSLNVRATSSSAYNYVITTDSTATVRITPTTLSLPAVAGNPESIAIENGTSNNVTITKTGTFFDVLSNGQSLSSVSAGATANGEVVYTSNYKVATSGTFNGFLEDYSNSTRNGTISAKNGNTTLASCTISQATDDVNRKTTTVETESFDVETPGVILITRESGETVTRDLAYSSKAFMPGDSTGVPVRLKSISSPNGFTVGTITPTVIPITIQPTVNNATVSNPYQLAFKYAKASNGADFGAGTLNSSFNIRIAVKTLTPTQRPLFSITRYEPTPGDTDLIFEFTIENINNEYTGSSSEIKTIFDSNFLPDVRDSKVGISIREDGTETGPYTNNSSGVTITIGEWATGDNSADGSIRFNNISHTNASNLILAFASASHSDAYLL